MLLRSEEEARQFVAHRCSSRSLASLEELALRLREASTTQNLVAAPTLKSLWVRHIADSAQLLENVSHETSPWLDLGSGAGFPGLVVAIMNPDRQTILVESRRLRIQWLNAMIEALALRRCRVIGRELQRIDTFDAAVISARAFAPLPRLIELSARFSTNATEWVLPKGRSAAQDIAQLPDSQQAKFHVKQSVTDPDARILVAKGRLELST